MKYLLSILILFSGLTFSENIKRLICDEPYTFYPELKERRLVSIIDSERMVTMWYLMNDGLKFEDLLYVDLKKPNNVYYEWAGFGWQLNRVTGILNGKHECKKVSAEAHVRAVEELREIHKKALKDRKI